MLSPNNNDTFISAFESFNAVVAACYGTDLSAGYEEKIESITKDYLELNINITPKIHAVMFHITEFCSLKGMGLAPWSEQTSESLHHDFTNIRKIFKVKDLEHPQ